MKRVWFFIIGISLITFSCKKENQPISEEAKIEVFELNNDSEDLKSRIEYTHESISFSDGEKALNYTLVASIAPITLNGLTLSATGVTADNDYVYASFHTRGAEIGGEILSLDVSTPETPIILQSAITTKYDFNDITLSSDHTKLWACGDELVNSWAYAFAMELSLNAQHIPQADAQWVKSFDSYSGNSITETSQNGDDYLWITSGSNGGMSVYERDIPDQEVFSFEADNCKHFDAGRDYGVILIGLYDNVSIIRVFDLSTPFIYTDYELPFGVTHLGKNGVAVNRDKVYLALGDDGVVAFDLRNGEITNVFKVNGNAYANAVFVEKDYVYVAYGAAGLYILDKSTMQSLGNWNYNGSCNFVAVVHETIFVANGSGEGFLVLTKD